MILRNTCEVKKWLRGIVCRKKELNLKLDFYKELCADFRDSPKMETSVEYYKGEINRTEDEIKLLLNDINRLFEMLDDEERMILTARYINNIKWDFIEFKVYFSRRQAIRIHDKAVLKLVGSSVNVLNEHEEENAASVKEYEKSKERLSDFKEVLNDEQSQRYAG